ncbi:MAG TPA: tetratricopeptide repeat protein [Nevskiaceae bacterium]
MSATAGSLDTSQMQAEYHILVGTMAARRQQPRVGAEQLLSAARESGDPQLASQAAALATVAGDDALALSATKELVKLKPDDPRALGALLELAVRGGQQVTAVDAGRRLLDADDADLADTYHGIAVLLGQAPLLRNADVADAVMRQLVALHPDLAEAHAAAALLAVQQYRSDTAIAQAREALKLVPGDVNTTMLLAAAFVQQGKLATADRTVETLLRDTPAADRADLRLGYAQLLMRYGRLQHARGVLQQQLGRTPDDVDTLLLLSQADLNTNRAADAQRLLSRIPASDVKHISEVQYFLGRAAESRHDYAIAIAHYKRAAGGSMALPAGLQHALILGRLHRVGAARELLIDLAQRHPDHLSDIIAADSEVLLQAGKGEEALQVLDRTLERAPDDTDLQYQRALTYDRTGHAEQAEKALQSLVEEFPLDPRYLNALGFVLTEHGKTEQLPQAQQLIERALRLTPEDPAVLDSMGWVLFKQGHSRQALDYLRQAQAFSSDPEIAAHLVTVLDAAGDHAAARETLRQALEQNPGNPGLEKVRQRLAP